MARILCISHLINPFPREFLYLYLIEMAIYYVY